jgi:hypothetical protein
VGSVNETITVTGEAPIVDVQSATRQTVINNEPLDSLPAGRNYRLYAALIPGISGGSDVGGQTASASGAVSIHGGSSNDQRVMIDGITLRNVAGVGNICNFIPDQGTAQCLQVVVKLAPQAGLEPAFARGFGVAGQQCSG